MEIAEAGPLSDPRRAELEAGDQHPFGARRAEDAVLSEAP
jgi:hypothetical protein